MGWRIFLVYAPKCYEYSFILAVKLQVILEQRSRICMSTLKAWQLVAMYLRNGQGGQKVGWFYSKKLLLDKK